MTLSEIIESLEMIDDSPTKQRCKVQFSPIFAPDKITQSIIIEFLPIETSLEIDVPSIDELVLKLISEYQLFPSTIPTEYLLLDIQTFVASRNEEGVPASTK
jgi:hypothetical protein